MVQTSISAVNLIKNACSELLLKLKCGIHICQTGFLLCRNIKTPTLVWPLIRNHYLKQECSI